MPFWPSESCNNAWHRTLGLVRVIFRLPPDYFVKRHNARGVPVEPWIGQEGKALICHLCGFMMVSYRLGENWLMETCSATGLKGLIANPRFEVWKAKVIESHCAEPHPAALCNQPSPAAKADGFTTSRH
jgi:hypothetical protein